MQRVNKVKKWYAGISIRMKMTMLFVLMSIIPVCLMSVVSLRLFSQNLEKSGVQDSQMYLCFLDYRMNQWMGEVHKSVLLSAHTDSVRSYFDPSQNLSDEDRELQRRYAGRELIGLRLRESAQSVMLIGADGDALEYSLQDFNSVLSVSQVDYTALPDACFSIYDAWADPQRLDGTMVIPYERKVISPENGEVVARLVVNYPELIFDRIYEDYDENGGSALYLINERGKIISATDKEQFGLDISNALGISTDEMATDSGSLHMGKYLMIWHKNTRRGYTALEVIPLNLFSSMFRPILSLLMSLACVCIIVCICLGALLSRSVTRPLYALINRVSNDADSAAHASARASQQNEIAIISERYDDVVSRLELLIGEYYEEQRKKKEAQIRALEFQITPHFLYNTLSTIIWLIDAGEGERAIEITQDLSRFFRISISKGRDFIPLREEVLHVKLYISIQKARYRDMIFVDYDVPEALSDYEIPKLVLQPLVENSIIHAMQTSHDKRCHILISARLEEDTIRLIVEDDGETATQETIEAMNRFLIDRNSVAEGSNYGIGISNVYDRIRMCFGDEYGLRYERKGGKTYAILRIKITRENAVELPDADRG